MSETLGVFVTSDRHLDKIIALCKAARKRPGLEVALFITHQGMMLTQDPRFAELDGLARMALCSVGFESHGFTPPVPGIEEKDHGTQARHGELIEECDRYVVF